MKVAPSHKADAPTKGGTAERAFDRRDFLMQSAAMTLFGTMGLEAVMDAVLNRLKDLESTRELAHAIARQLERNGLSGRALAEEAVDSYVCPTPESDVSM